MIAACPKCGTRHRVERERVGAEGARLRCAKCKAVFRVRAPADEAVSSVSRKVDTPTSSPARDVAPSSPDTSALPPPSPPLSPESQLDRDRMVLVADSNVETAKHTAAALASRGLQPVLVHDGVEALLTIQRMLPRVVVLDAALPRMYGFQICEILKRNESLHHIKVVLVGTIYHKSRYHRPPSELYGADVYLEQPDLPEGLLPFMMKFGLALDEASSRPAEPIQTVTPTAPASSSTRAPVAPDPATRPPEVAPVPPPGFSAPAASSATASNATQTSATPTASAEPVAVADDELAEERAKAQRLARIIVSDIVLYQPDRFEEAVHAGNVVEAMDTHLEEGRALFAQRIEARVREERDFLVEELLRVARERGMQ